MLPAIGDRKESQTSTSSSPLEASQPCRQFEFPDILLATDPSTYVNTLVKGTFGYLDPNYFTTGKLTRKSDVYAFGVVLLEVLCRKRAVDRSLDEEQCGLVTWAQDSIREGNLKHIINYDIRGQISPKCLKEFVRIAERCLLNNPKQRPTMAEVVGSLCSVQNLQEKTNSTLKAPGKTVFERMLHMLPFPYNNKNSGNSNSKPSSNSNVNTRNAGDVVGADSEDFTDPMPRLKSNSNIKKIRTSCDDVSWEVSIALHSSYVMIC
ncbi:hypothetical protein L2E82_38530 [Cichorium intybus]|uniref:Uncharacterized protein n=1 Tax=Cichorium intybus TaxID=13427 RepID=A0ACB9AHU2_CICIN|nr:hypothetical protein L2E82_38530 [Cichorium intybus]